MDGWTDDRISPHRTMISASSILAELKIYPCFEDHLYEGFPKISGQSMISLHVFGLQECHFHGRKEKKKRPMGIRAPLENQLGHLPKFQKLHIFSISPSGFKIELIFHSMSSTVSQIRPDFQNFHICMKLGMWPSSRNCTYKLFLPQGVEIELIFALRAAISEIRANFQNCHIWA